MTNHKLSKSKEYIVWHRMKNSCQNLKIPLSPQWKNFTAFISEMKNMPEGCNAVLRIDDNLPYCKQNCKWGHRNKGRQPGAKGSKSAKAEKDKYSICLSLDKNQLDYIKRQALTRSAQEGKIIEANELIREALVKAFPLPAQYDMFGDRK